MKCVFCKNGETRPGSAVFVATSPESVQVVRDVPAEICDNCGEEYFDSETTGHLLEKSVGEADPDIQVEVRRYVIPA